MVESFLDEIFEKVKSSNTFSDFDVSKANEHRSVKYPITKPYITLGADNVKSDIFLLGMKDYNIFSESIFVSVTTGEESGRNFCERTAKDICLEILRLDSEKRINSVSVGKCAYDKNIFGYRTVMIFGLSERAIDLGGE